MIKKDNSQAPDIKIIKPTEAIFTQPGNFIGIFAGISLAVAYLLMKLLTSNRSKWLQVC
jgi:hypothetical protein